MKISNKIREVVRSKFGGKCAFCGMDLHMAGGMHIWDIEPIKRVVTESGELAQVNTEIENLYPACKSCAAVRIKRGHRRGKMTIEEFRKDCIQSFDYLRCGGLTATSYGRAIRFGQIIETHKPVVFYFERYVPCED